jgi:hypothetical protein
MNFGAFRAQINECRVVLKLLEMDSEFNPLPGYPPSPRAFFKGMNYIEIWKACLQNRYYHFQLFDNSLIYFGYCNANEFSLSYYDFPFVAISYYEFINTYGFTYYDVGEELREEYDDYLTTCKVKESIASIRYDINYEQYAEAKHPISHLHIGYDNNIRIRTERIMGPISFLCFILRQNYPDKWIEYIKTKKKQTLLNIVRDKLDVISPKHISDWDKCEIHLL